MKRTEITYSSVSNNLSKLEQNNHIRKVNNKYYVTPLTEIYYTTLMDFKKSVELINDYKSFWAKHNIDQLSVESIKRLTDLKDSKLVETTIVDIYRTHNTTKKQLLESKSVRAIFPFLHPDHPEMIETILENEGIHTYNPAMAKPIIETIDSNFNNLHGFIINYPIYNRFLICKRL